MFEEFEIEDEGPNEDEEYIVPNFIETCIGIIASAMIMTKEVNPLTDDPEAAQKRVAGVFNELSDRVSGNRPKNYKPNDMDRMLLMESLLDWASRKVKKSIANVRNTQE